MSPLRKEAFRLLESLPEENLLSVIRLIHTATLGEVERPLKISSRLVDGEQIEVDRRNFIGVLEKNFARKSDAADIRKAINFITSSLSHMNESDKYKTVAQFREERLSEKYAEHLN